MNLEREVTDGQTARLTTLYCKPSQSELHCAPLQCMSVLNNIVNIRAGGSPTFQDPGTPLYGLAGTRVPASPIEEVLSRAFGESLASPFMWTRTRKSH